MNTFPTGNTGLGYFGYETRERKATAFLIYFTGLNANNWYIYNTTITSVSTSTYTTINMAGWRWDNDLVENITIDGLSIIGAAATESADCGGLLLLSTGIKGLTIRNIFISAVTDSFCNGGCTIELLARISPNSQLFCVQGFLRSSSKMSDVLVEYLTLQYVRTSSGFFMKGPGTSNSALLRFLTLLSLCTFQYLRTLLVENFVFRHNTVVIGNYFASHRFFQGSNWQNALLYNNSFTDLTAIQESVGSTCLIATSC